jgi:hypothetical protein
LESKQEAKRFLRVLNGSFRRINGGFYRFHARAFDDLEEMNEEEIAQYSPLSVTKAQHTAAANSSRQSLSLSRTNSLHLLERERSQNSNSAFNTMSTSIVPHDGAPPLPSLADLPFDSDAPPPLPDMAAIGLQSNPGDSTDDPPPLPSTGPMIPSSGPPSYSKLAALSRGANVPTTTRLTNGNEAYVVVDPGQMVLYRKIQSGIDAFAEIGEELMQNTASFSENTEKQGMELYMKVKQFKRTLQQDLETFGVSEQHPVDFITNRDTVLSVPGNLRVEAYRTCAGLVNHTPFIRDVSDDEIWAMPEFFSTSPLPPMEENKVAVTVQLGPDLLPATEDVKTPTTLPSCRLLIDGSTLVSDIVRNAVGPLFGAAGVQPPATDSLLLKALGIGEYLKPERRVLDCAYVRDCIRTHEPVHVVLITRPTVDHKAIQFNREMQQRLEVEYKSFGTSTKQFLRPSFPGLQMDRCEILSTVADYLPYTEVSITLLCRVINTL